MSGIWPGETQCVAMLGFDVDGVSSLTWMISIMTILIGDNWALTRVTRHS